MPMIRLTPVEDKRFDPQSGREELQAVIRSAAAGGTPVQEGERG